MVFMCRYFQTKFLFWSIVVFSNFPLVNSCFSQTTVIRGYASVTGSYQRDSLNVALGEQVLFITSQISDRMSFLGESVFKFSNKSPTDFDVSIERIIMKYNFHSNHSIIAGKIHTPVSYWNYTYHHGVVFTPTIERPLFFAANIIPFHSKGAGVQAANLGAHKFGYDFFIGSGIGSSDIKDNDNRKSLTAAIRFRPILKVKEFTMGFHYYNDYISKGAKMHHGSINRFNTKQHIWTASLVYFGEKFEAITEGITEYNRTDTTGSKHITAAYAYAGVRIKDKLVPYIKADAMHYQKGQLLYPEGQNLFSIIAGMRYELNYLSVLKLEFEHLNRQVANSYNSLSLQWSVGF